MGLFFGFILGWASQIGSVRGASCRWYGLFSLANSDVHPSRSSHEHMDIKTNLNFHQPKCASSSDQRWGFTNSNVEIRWYNQFDIGTNGPVSSYCLEPESVLLFGHVILGPSVYGFWPHVDHRTKRVTASRLRLLWSWGRESSWTFGYVWKWGIPPIIAI